MVHKVTSEHKRRKRGRPPIASDRKLASVDKVIGRTVHIMIGWGMRQRTIGRGTRAKLGVYEAVGEAAHQELGRTDADGKRALTADRIKQIYEKWRKSKRVQSTRVFYTKESLAERRPRKDLIELELARILLLKKGRWVPPRDRMSWETRVRRSLAGKPIPVGPIHGDLVLAPKFRSAIEASPRSKPLLIPRVKKTG